MAESVTYVVTHWKAPRERFIHREIESMRARGLNVDVYVLRQHEPSNFVRRLSARSFLWSLLWVLRRPARLRRWLGGLWIASISSSRASVRKNLAAAVIGVDLARFLAERGTEKVVAHYCGFPASVAWTASRLVSAKVAIIGHADDIFGPERDRLWLTKLRDATWRFAVTERGRSEIANSSGRHCLLHFMELSPVDERQVARGESSYDVVSVGGLDLKKGHDQLLRALGSGPLSGARAVIVGDGPQRLPLQALAAELELEDRVHFAGAATEDEVRTFLDGSRLFALLCRKVSSGAQDGIPVAMLEAIAHELPIVVTEWSGVGELQLSTASVVPADSPDEAAEAMARVLRDPPAPMAIRADRDRILERHGVGVGAGNLIRAMELDRSGPTGLVEPQQRHRRRMEEEYDTKDALPPNAQRWTNTNAGNREIARERRHALKELAGRAHALQDALLVEVGCGRGNILEELWEDFPRADVLGVDLLPGRLTRARASLPGRLAAADATCLPFPDEVCDVVVLSTLLSSVPHSTMRRLITSEALRILRPGGVVLVYDLRLPSPNNRALRPISRRELRTLFPDEEWVVRSLTVLPPLSRRLPAAAYRSLAKVPLLRSHLAVAIQKVQP